MIASLLIALGFVLGLMLGFVLLNLIIDLWPGTVPRWFGLTFLCLICTPPALALERIWRRFNRGRLLRTIESRREWRTVQRRQIADALSAPPSPGGEGRGEGGPQTHKRPPSVRWHRNP